MKQWLKRASVALVASLLAFSALALELQDAKSQGLVGEQSNGLLGAVKASAEVNALVADINAQRKQVYQDLAGKQGLTYDQVAARAGQLAIEKTPKGQYVQNAAGKWVQK